VKRRLKKKGENVNEKGRKRKEQAKVKRIKYLQKGQI
jgi:hypothetical protein